MDYYYLDIYAPSLSIDEEGPTQNGNAYTTRPTGTLHGDNVYFMETTAPVIPDINMIYRTNYFGKDCALYYSFGIMQAAPEVVFPKGLAQIDFGTMAAGEMIAMAADQTFDEYTYTVNIAKRTEYFIGNTFGASIKILNFLSTALGVRYIYGFGNQTIKVKNPRLVLGGNPMDTGNWDINVDYAGYGMGIIAGIHLKPVDVLNIGLRYEYYFPMIMKKNTKSFEVNPLIEASGQLNIFKDGTPHPEFNGGTGYLSGDGKSSFKATYPQSFSAGIAYNLTQKLKVETGSDLYFRKYVDLDGRENDYTIGYRIGICAEYFLLDTLSISAGYSYYDPGIKKNKRNEIDPLLICHTIGCGFSTTINQDLKFTLGGFYVIYPSATVYQEVIIKNESLLPGGRAINYIKKELDEETFCLTFGFTYSINLNKEESAVQQNKVLQTK